ncbi:hypothetical protein ACSBOB_29605 [Mesorhizobium sp. ASY16-5R]|uniref:hypothetical protein n=1 Tax=Mesorhizobium sp. ASY16-5R TaxID=3445772 RepID=UPI003F9FAE69
MISKRIVFAAIFVAMTVPRFANAEGNMPIIIPERLQELAFKYPIADRLDINWNNAQPDDIGRYLGFLASVAVVAEEIGKQNNRSAPSDEDFVAAIGIQCIFPPNKPPLVESSWPAQVPAFYNEGVRNAIRAAVGPEAVALPAQLEKSGPDAYPTAFEGLPTTSDQYFDKVFNVNKLPGAQ